MGRQDLGSDQNVLLSEFTTSNWCCKLLHVASKNAAERWSLCVLKAAALMIGHASIFIQDCCKFSPLSGWPSAQNTRHPKSDLKFVSLSTTPPDLLPWKDLHVFGAWMKSASRIVPRLPVERVVWKRDYLTASWLCACHCMVGGCILDKGIQINYIGNNRLGGNSNHAGSGLNNELVSTAVVLHHSHDIRVALAILLLKKASKWSRIYYNNTFNGYFPSLRNFQ